MVNDNYKERKRAYQEILKHIKENYPFNSKRDFLIFKINYDYFFEKLKKDVNTDRDFYIDIERLLVTLNNSHTKLGKYPAKRFFKPLNYKVEIFESNFYLIKNKKIIGQILFIDGIPIKTHVVYWSKRLAASSKQFKFVKVKDFLLLDQKGKDMVIEIKELSGKIIGLKIKRKRINNKNETFSDIFSRKIISQDIGYLNIRSWNSNFSDQMKIYIDKTLDKFTSNGIKSLIIDVRSNPGGDSRIAAHLMGKLFNRKVLIASIKKRKSKTKFNFNKYNLYVEPRKEYFFLPIILLINSYCLSSNEYFIGGLRDNKRAYLIGEKTGGGSGNPKIFSIQYKNSSFQLWVSTWQYLRPNKQRLEGVGIIPHKTIRPSMRDFEAGRDKVLEAGIVKARSFK